MPAKHPGERHNYPNEIRVCGFQRTGWVGSGHPPQGEVPQIHGRPGLQGGRRSGSAVLASQLLPRLVEHAFLAGRKGVGVRLEQSYDLGVVASPAGVARG